MTTVTGYQLLTRNLDKSLARIATRADVKREAEYFLKRIGDLETIDDFLKDDRAYRFAMTAHGLKDMIYGKAFMKKVLSEGIDGRNAFAVQLADQRFRDFADTFNFARHGKTATTFTKAQQGTVDRYVRIVLEDEAGKTDEGVRLALYFKRKAPEVTSIFGLMGDPALYKVVQTALGLPQASSGVDVDRQAEMIGRRIDIEAIKDGSGVESFLAKFTARWQLAQGTAATAVPQIGLSQNLLATMDNSTLIALQSLKRF
jgi:Protein of unknown function (DUF1217)